MIKNICIIILLAGVFFGCSDAQMSSIKAYGDSGTIKCYSGGKLIYEGTSTGRIATTESSDGWELRDSRTGKFVRVSGDCVLEN